MLNPINYILNMIFVVTLDLYMVCSSHPRRASLRGSESSRSLNPISGDRWTAKGRTSNRPTAAIPTGPKGEEGRNHEAFIYPVTACPHIP